MHTSDDRPESGNSQPAEDSETRKQKGGEAATTRFGMEDGDNTDVPATGVDPERQSPSKK